MTRDLFSPDGLASTVAIPAAPALDAERYAEWPAPGLTAEDTARWCLALSPQYADMLAAVIHSQGSAELIGGQVESLIPADWRVLMGRFLYGNLCARLAEERGVAVKYVSHDGGGFHFTHRTTA